MSELPDIISFIGNDVTEGDFKVNFNKLHTFIEDLNLGVGEINGEVSSLNSDVSSLNSNVISLDSRVSTLENTPADSTPVGTIVMHASSTLPSGYLICDGSSVSTTTYPELYSAIGTTYGGGGTSFNLPNITDRFVQGTSSSLGSTKSAGIPNISGTAYLRANGLCGGYSGALTMTQDVGTETIINCSDSGDLRCLHFTASNSNSIYGSSSTVQPPSILLRFLIKYI